MSRPKFLCEACQTETQYAGYQCQRRTPTTGRITKIITMIVARNRSPNTSVHCTLVSELPRKTQTQHSQALEGTTLYLHREATEQKSTPVMCVGPPRVADAPAADTGQLTYEHPSCATVEGPLPFSHGV